MPGVTKITIIQNLIIDLRSVFLLEPLIILGFSILDEYRPSHDIIRENLA